MPLTSRLQSLLIGARQRPALPGDAQRGARGCAPQLLLRALVDPSCLKPLAAADWDLLIRVARAARLLGTLAARLEAAGDMAIVPERARALLQSERCVAAYRMRMVSWELDRLGLVLGSRDVPVVLLKGAAYVVQGFRCADGRSLADVDILVPHDRIGEVEEALLAGGWEAQPLDSYDDRYYRGWSHEIPPLRYSGSPLEVDVHHNVLPPLGRVKPDTAALWARTVVSPLAPFRLLAPEDQLIHAALHLAQDSDLTNRYRDIVDIDALVREFSSAAGFWNRLVARAVEQGTGRPLQYALSFANELLGTPVPSHIAEALGAHAPPALVKRLVATLANRALMPPDPDHGYTTVARLASWMLLIRTTWLRLPLHLFLLHAAAKTMPFVKVLSTRGRKSADALERE